MFRLYVGALFFLQHNEKLKTLAAPKLKTVNEDFQIVVSMELNTVVFTMLKYF